MLTHVHPDRPVSYFPSCFSNGRDIIACQSECQSCETLDALLGQSKTMLRSHHYLFMIA